MTKRRAIIRLSLILLGIVALLSYAAYIVQKQNDLNASLRVTQTLPLLPSSTQNSAPATTSISVPVNDAVDTDKTSVQYKTVSGANFSFEAPLDWNSFTEDSNGCSIVNIVNSHNAVIALWPDTCSEPPDYKTVTPIQGYVVGTNTADMGVYGHVVATFALLP